MGGGAGGGGGAGWSGGGAPRAPGGGGGAAGSRRSRCGQARAESQISGQKHCVLRTWRRRNRVNLGIFGQNRLRAARILRKPGCFWPVTARWHPPPPARPRGPPGRAGAPGGGRRRAGGQAGGVYARAASAQAGASGVARWAGCAGERRRATGRQAAGRGGRRAVSRVDRAMGRETRADQRGMSARGAVFAKKRGCAPRSPPPWNPTKVIRGFFQEERRATTLPRHRTPSPPAHNLAFWRKRRRKRMA